MTKTYDICGIGNALVDEQYAVPESIIQELGLELDQMTLATASQQEKIENYLNSAKLKPISACGGSATNTLVAASYLGLNCVQLCRVSPDIAGNIFLQSLHDCNIDCPQPSTAFNNNLKTGKCIVLVTPDSKRTMSTYLGISAHVEHEFIHTPSIKAAKYLYMEGYMVTNETNLSALKLANTTAITHQTKRILSLSDPGVVEYFNEPLRDLCSTPLDLLFCNEIEALTFTKTASIEAACKELQSYATQFAITLGKNGVLIYDGSNKTTIPGKNVVAIDSNGAGDIFAGAFLSQFLQKKSFYEASLFANHAASVLVQHFGPRLNKEDYLNL